MVEALIVDVPVLAAPVVIGFGLRVTVAVAKVNVSVSATEAVTVICPAVDTTTTPVSIVVA